ncbi:hypothetical protein BCV70DRAFT_230393 [Testicularia cyperi]|uniref:Protein Zds1 C-terminal domain-containing protein n=1 Tax=Testicularia cyperi TaxID=1882483 RepID=A0A317XVB7_9BASI|nr:hypothetical protein BCV70DRAFT_230393 [Testicularia cyperi]
MYSAVQDCTTLGASAHFHHAAGCTPVYVCELCSTDVRSLGPNVHTPLPAALLLSLQSSASLCHVVPVVAMTPRLTGTPSPPLIPSTLDPDIFLDLLFIPHRTIEPSVFFTCSPFPPIPASSSELLISCSYHIRHAQHRFRPASSVADVTDLDDEYAVEALPAEPILCINSVAALLNLVTAECPLSTSDPQVLPVTVPRRCARLRLLQGRYAARRSAKDQINTATAARPRHKRVVPELVPWLVITSFGSLCPNVARFGNRIDPCRPKMSAGSMGITDDEFQREVEALKSHRRHSVNRPVLDPDLPDLAAVYGGGQELLAVPSPERERRGYDLVDDGAVPVRTPSASSSLSGDTKGYPNERSQFTARRRARGSDRSSGSDSAGTYPSSSYSIATANSPTDVSDSQRLPSPSASSASSGRRSPSSASLSPKDPSHLFWVPASVHPEISPSDFRNFLKEHAARAVNQHAGGDGAHIADDALPPLSVSESPIAQRLNSVRQQQASEAHGGLVGRSTSLSRRGSTLRRQYRPENDPDDTDEDKPSRPLQRNRSGFGRGSAYGLGIPNLTIDDLQKLEAAAEEASQSHDPAMLRSVLRRTLSLNTGSDLDTVDAVPSEPVEDPDAPIIVPKPGQILRRAARTKIRKASTDSTSRGSLAARRRGTHGGTDSDSASEGGRAWELRSSSAEAMERRQSGHSEVSSAADDDSSAGDSSSRPASAEATDSIVEAYSRDSYHSDASQRTSLTSYVDASSDKDGATTSGPTLVPSADEMPSPPVTPTQDSVVLAMAGTPGYFDIDDRHAFPAEAGPAGSGTAETIALVDSPRTSPVHERGSSNQIRPIPISHVPPVPSFEKTRPKKTPQLPSPPSPASEPSTAPAIEQSASISPAIHSAEASSGLASPVPYTGVRPDGAPPTQNFVPSLTLTTSQQPVRLQAAPAPAPHAKPKDKEKKGGFGLSWFGIGKDDDEDHNRNKTEKELQRKKEKHEKRERKEREREEKDRDESSSSSSFLGALFGKKKGNDEGMPHPTQRPPMHSQLTAGSLLERNELAMQGKNGLYYYSRYPIHIERAVYRLSHIKLANPRRPLYEQVLISNLMFWYLSIINRANMQQASNQQSLQKQGQQNHHQQYQQQTNASSSTGVEGGGAHDQNGSAAALDTSSAYDGMETPGGSPESEEAGSAMSDSWNQNGGGATVKQKRGGLVKPNRAPAGSGRGRSAEMPMKQPGYGMQHRQIDDDLKMGGGLTPATSGFVVGQVVDVQALQANTPYRLVPDPRSADGAGLHDQAKSATTDYLGLGSHFGSSEPLWPETVGSSSGTGSSVVSSTSIHSSSSICSGTSADDAQSEEKRWRMSSGSSSTVAGRPQRTSSPSKPHLAEAEKERAWLGGRGAGSGRASPNGSSSGYGTISNGQSRSDSLDASVDGAVLNGTGHGGNERPGQESHPQGRSLSLGGIGAMHRSGDVWKSAAEGERTRKTSAGSLTHSVSGQSLGRQHSGIDTIDEAGSMATSSSASSLDRRQGSESRPAINGHIDFPSAPGSSAMLEAARTSQSRRR